MYVNIKYPQCISLDILVILYFAPLLYTNTVKNALLAANTALRYSTNVVCIVNGRVV